MKNNTIKRNILSIILIAVVLLVVGYVACHNATAIDKYAMPAESNNYVAYNYANLDNPCANPDIVCEGEVA